MTKSTGPEDADELDEGVSSFIREVAALPKVEGALEPLVGRGLGHFQLEARLGEGGMGTVYRAHDQKLDRKVALKVLQPRVAPQAQRELLYREARRAAALSHPNIASVYEVGEEGALCYLVFELVSGTTLRERLADGLDFATALALAQALASALAYAHGQGCLHGDVKPENVAVTPEGQLKLLDFGHALLLTAQEPSRAIGGTRGYLAPEVAGGATPTFKADIFAYGRVLAELLAAVRPAPARGQLKPLEALVARASVSDPAARPEDGAALVAELQALTPRRTGWRWALAAAALVAVALGAAWWSSAHRVTPPKLEYHRLTTQGETEVESAAISADGRYIAAAEDLQLYIHDLQDRSKRRVELPAGVFPGLLRWLPDNTGLVGLVIEGSAMKLGTLSLGPPARFKVLTESVYLPSQVSADGKRMAGVDPSGQTYALFDLAAGTLKTFPITSGERAGYVALSPDGQRIALAFPLRGGPEAPLSVRTVDLASGGAETLVFQEPQTPGQRPWLDLGWLDDRQLIVSITRNAVEAGTTFYLLRLDAAGRRVSEPVALGVVQGAGVMSLTASASGRVSYVSRTPRTDLYWLGPGKQPRSRLTNDVADDLPVGFLPEDGRVLFISDQGGQRGLFAQSPTEEARERLLIHVEGELQQTNIVPGEGGTFWRVEANGAPQLWALKRGPWRLEPSAGGLPPSLAGVGEYSWPSCTSTVPPRCVVIAGMGERAKLHAFNPLTQELTATVVFPEAALAMGLVLSADGERAYVAIRGVPRLIEVPLASGEVIRHETKGCLVGHLLLLRGKLAFARVCPTSADAATVLVESVDLRTGETRELQTLGSSYINALVSDGEDSVAYSERSFLTSIWWAEGFTAGSTPRR